eukprot:1161035-Pelagomonas_calceolata.AAC.8
MHARLRTLKGGIQNDALLFLLKAYLLLLYPLKCGIKFGADMQMMQRTQALCSRNMLSHDHPLADTYDELSENEMCEKGSCKDALGMEIELESSRIVLFLHLLQNRALGACTTGLQETEKRNHASQRRPRAFWKGSLTCKLARVSPKGLQTLTAHS